MTGHSSVYKAEPLHVAVMQPSSYIRTSSKNTPPQAKSMFSGAMCSTRKAAWLRQPCTCYIGELLLSLSEDNNFELLTNTLCTVLQFIIKIEMSSFVSY